MGPYTGPPRPRQKQDTTTPAEAKYSMGQLDYDPNYLDSIAPTAPPPKFFSGSFGKIFFLMLGLFGLAVSIIVATQGKDNTLDLQTATVRLELMEKTSKAVHKNLKSNNLSEINSNYQIWLNGAFHEAEELLAVGGVERTDYNKEMVKEEEAAATELDAKFEDARLSARLNRVYSTTMTIELEKLINLFTKMQKSGSGKIAEFAKKAVDNLEPIRKQFSEYKDDGN